MEVELIIDLKDLDISAIDAVETKNSIADRIEDDGIGTVSGSGFGLGLIDMDIDLAEDDEASARLRAILDEFNVLGRSSIRPLPEDE